MDGTILNKKYNLVERVKALEESSGGIPDYSTEEYSTGRKWIDGNKIYGQVFDFSTAKVVANNAWTNTGENTNGTTFINAFGIASSGEIFAINAGSDMGKLVLMVNAYSAITLKTVYVEYTKTESEV